MPRYWLFGLLIATDRPVPFLTPVSGSADPDVFVRWLTGDAQTLPADLHHALTRAAAAPPIGDGAGMATVISSDRYLRVTFADDTTFVTDRDGARVWVDSPPGASLEDDLSYLIGPIAGLLLHLRRILCLHASAASVGGVAAVFVGPAGAGKSTIAAEFGRSHHVVLADDIAAIDEHEGHLFLRRGPPQIRLWPDIVSEFYGDPTALPRWSPCHPDWDKRYLDVSQRRGADDDDRTPLAAIFVLDDSRHGESIRVVRLHPADALVALLRNVSVTPPVDRAAGAHEFVALSRIAERTPVSRVTFPTGTQHLAELRRRLIAELPTVRAEPSR